VGGKKLTSDTPLKGEETLKTNGKAESPGGGGKRQKTGKNLVKNGE